MCKKWMSCWQDASMQTRMCVIVVPLVVVPMVMLAVVGFLVANREANTARLRTLAERESDLRTLAEHLTLPAADRGSRRALEHTLQRFAERGNRLELVYPQVRYLDQHGEEVARVGQGQVSSQRGRVAEAPWFAAVQRLKPGEVYLSPVAPTMLYAMPVYEPGGDGRAPALQGVVALDFVYPRQEFQRTTRVIAWTGLVIMGLSVGLALALPIAWVRRLTQPIRRLAEAARCIAMGQTPGDVPINSHDELGRLAHAFNDMAASLARHEAALQRKVDETRTLYEIGQEITAQVALAPTLRLIVERAHQLLHAEVSMLALRQGDSDTFAMQAHSGTVPPALAALRLRPGEGVGGRTVATGLPIAVGDYQTEYLDSPLLINNVLDLSKIAAGAAAVRVRSFALEPVVDLCLHAVGPLVNHERLRLAKAMEADIPPLMTDEEKVQQILLHLLHNAVKFTPEGTVTVTARYRAGEVALAVADTGIGIPEQACGLIFDAFQQVDSSPTRPYGGMGLGLSISRQLARILGGDITVRSTVGAGSTFTVTLPLRYGTAAMDTRVTVASSHTMPGDPSESSRPALVLDDGGIR